MASELLIPNDLAGCQALIAELATVLTAQQQTIATKDQTIIQLRQKSEEQSGGLSNCCDWHFKRTASGTWKTRIN